MVNATRSGWTAAAGHPPPLPAGFAAFTPAAQIAWYQNILQAQVDAAGRIIPVFLDENPAEPPFLTYYRRAGGVLEQRAIEAFANTNAFEFNVISNCKQPDHYSGRSSKARWDANYMSSIQMVIEMIS